MNKKGCIYNKMNMKLILILILIIILIVIGIPFGMVVIQPLISMIVILFLVCKFIYEIDIKKSFINSVMYSLVYTLIECSIYWILSMRLDYVANYLCTLNLGISSFIIFLGTYFFDKLEFLYSKNKYYLYIILTIVINIFIIIFSKISTTKISDLYSIVIKNNIEYNNIVNVAKLAGFMEAVFPYILIIINIILISIFFNSIKSEKEKAKIQLANEKLDMQYKYYLMVKESQEKMKHVYHDMNNHMKNIKHMKNRNESIDKYINNIEDEVKSSRNLYNTGNILLDIILHEKSKECIENNIDFNVGIDFRKCEFIDMIDISSIFSNLIDNAIEACKKINDNNRERYITIKSTFINGYLVVRCENSKINKILFKDNKILTSKNDKFIHGIGIESIKSSVKKYNGELKVKNYELKFIANIYFPIE
ncbi:MAG: ATP-binding protein [Clostridia bacterium]